MGKWGQYAQSTKTSGGGGGGGGLFIKIDPGQRVEFMVPPSAKPHRRYRRWLQAAGKYEDTDGPGEGVQCRILLPVMVVAGNEPKVLEMATSTFTDLAACLDHPKVGGTDQIYEISRTGTGKDTRWKIQRIDRAEPNQVSRCERLSLPDVSQWGDPVPMEEADPTASTKPRGGNKTEPLPAQSTQSADPVDEDVPF